LAARLDRRKKMVNIMIYIEGKQSENPAALTVDNSAVFRENFHKLFSQKLPPTEFNLRINMFGTVTQTKNTLKKIEIQDSNSVFLIDLDAPKERKDERLAWYNPSFRKKIFFMIQEMEAWILSGVSHFLHIGSRWQIYPGRGLKKRVTSSDRYLTV